MTLADAAEKLEAWHTYYNEERPHGAIGNKAPITLTKSGASPACHLGAAGKLCLLAVQGWGSDHSRWAGLYYQMEGKPRVTAGRY